MINFAHSALVRINPDEAGVIDMCVAGQDRLWGECDDPGLAFKGYKRAADYADGLVETGIGPELRKQSIITYHTTHTPGFYLASVVGAPVQPGDGLVIIVGLLVKE